MNSPQIRSGFGSGSQVSTRTFYGGQHLEIEAGSRAKCSLGVCKNGAYAAARLARRMKTS